ncbi:MAG: DUF3618 domain-containing protein [Nocardioidaceae bacterium]|nr:DUF3618 domain-containing protein [Nocardioidaceae bacterium]
MARGSNGPAQRDPDDIVVDIEATRDRLGGTIDTVIDRVNPKNIARRMLEDVKAHFVDDSGAVSAQKVAPVAGAVAAVAVFVVALRHFVGD